MELPNDVIIDILLRLPVKSLVRFKSVCWSWYTIISCPGFVTCHLEWSRKTDPKLHIVYKGSQSGSPFGLRQAELDSFDENTILDNPLAGPDCYPIVVGEANGLLCLSSCSGNHFCFLIFLYNPTTRSTYKLPPPLLVGVAPRYEHSLGFGYDAANDDCKVVKVSQLEKKNDGLREYAQVYSWNTDSWKRVSPMPFRLTPFLFSGTCVNGVVHWVASSDSDQKLQDVIAGFDLAEEKHFLVPQPLSLEPLLGRRCMIDIGVLDGSLSQVCNFLDDHFHDVWVMKEYGVQSSWSKLFRVVDEEPEPSRIFLRPVTFSKDKKELFLMALCNFLLSYNVEEKKVHKCSSLDHMSWDAHTYEETLVSADGG